MNGTDQFYTRLPVNEIPLAELLEESHLFFRVPADWSVVITDVKNSTGWIRDGKHETVNLVATGSIIAVLNIAFKQQVQLPYFFGGDGATFLVPPLLKKEILCALEIHREQTRENFGFHLRVGAVPVSSLYDAGAGLSLTKLRVSPLFVIPVVLGDGLSEAERLIKGDGYRLDLEKSGAYELDLSGMQCRWDKIKPPENLQEIVSLIVTSTSTELQGKAFGRVIRLVDRIYGQPATRRPITVTRLRLRATLGQLLLEMRTRFGGRNLLYLLRTRLTTLLGPLYFKTKWGRRYLDNVVAMSDTLVMDGRINTVISGSSTQREALTQALDQLEHEGLIHYGIWVSAESVISCYVKNMNDNHVHFVDGAGGGYTQAATELKKKVAFIKN